jgi:ABC-2 type transport system permease protein
MTQTTTYKPTFLQKLLGRNYKWWYLLKFNLNSSRANLSAFYVVQLSNISQSLITVFLWFQSGASPFLLTYLLMGRVFTAFTNSFYHEDLDHYIQSGKITSKLMYPQNFLKLETFATIGERIAKNPTSILGFIVAAIIGNFIFTPLVMPSVTNLILLLFFIPIGFFTQFILSFIVGSLSFFMENKRDSWAYHNAYETLNQILAGAFIPLTGSIFPSFLQFLPFAYLLHHPMQIYLGKYSNLEIFYVFLGGVAWCFVLYFLAKLVFKMGLKKNESVGL